MEVSASIFTLQVVFLIVALLSGVAFVFVRRGAARVASVLGLFGAFLSSFAVAGVHLLFVERSLLSVVGPVVVGVVLAVSLTKGGAFKSSKKTGEAL